MTITNRRPSQVSNQRLRKAFLDEQERGRVNASLVAVRLGWMNNGRWRQSPDTNRVLRSLGIIEEACRGKTYRRRLIDYDRAVLLCEAIGLDPVDVGL